MVTSGVGISEFVSRFLTGVKHRGPESVPWSASLGGLLLGVAMLYHVSVVGDSYTNATMLLGGYLKPVTLSPVQTAVLVLTGVGSLAFAGWTRVTERNLHVLIGTASGTLASIGYLLLLDAFTPAGIAYPLIHSYRATILASVLFGFALISTASLGTWREPSGLQRILVGPDPRRLRQWGAGGGFLLVVGAGGVVLGLLPYWAHTPFEAFEVLDARPVLATVVMIGWFGLAALPGYLREGLLSSWALIACPVGGSTVALSYTDRSIIFQFEQVDSIISAIWVFSTGVILVAVIVGSVGYFFGVVIRWI